MIMCQVMSLVLEVLSKFLHGFLETWLRCLAIVFLHEIACASTKYVYNALNDYAVMLMFMSDVPIMPAYI